MRIRFGEWTLDRGRRELLRGDVPVPLTPKAFELLDLLIEKRPRVVTKAQIYDRLWPSTFVSEVNVSCLVFEVRRALEDDARRPRWVRTSHGAGYAFDGAVDGVEEPPPVGGNENWCRLVLPDREVLLPQGATIIGRAAEAAVCLRSASVSRHHARITVAGQQAILEDLGSKNGTTWRGREISGPTPLTDGDPVVVGNVSLVFRVVSQEDSTDTGVLPLGSART